MAGITYTQKDSSVYVQFGPGRDVHYLGDCINLDSIPNPRGDLSLISQWNRSRTRRNIIGSTRGEPATLSFTVQDLHQSARAWLEGVNCPFNLYALQRCGTAGVFNAWDRGSVVANCVLTDDTLNNIANRSAEEQTTHDYAISGYPPRMDVRQLSASRKATTETNNLLCIALRGGEVCEGVCGPGRGAYEHLFVGAKAGSAAKANGLFSDNDGDGWTAAATQPFAIDEDIVSATSFEVGSGAYRVLVARGLVAGKPASVAFSDDGGVTWEAVDVGVTNGEAAAGPKALASFDAEHVWLATNKGRIFFSNDGGATWQAQASALAASAAEPLHAISVVDDYTAWAVGDSDTIIRTADGGANWLACQATATGDYILSVQGFDNTRAVIGTDGTAATGSLLMTFDGGETWIRRGAQAGLVDPIGDISFINDHVGVLFSTASGASKVYNCIDGGNNWREWKVPANSGLTSVVMVDTNVAFLVGNAKDATGVIMQLSG